MNSLIRIMSAETSCMDDSSFLTMTNPTRTIATVEASDAEASVPKDAILTSPAASLHVSGLPSPFATVVFAREDYEPHEPQYHVATMRVPLSSADITVRQLAKEAMKRLTSILRRHQKRSTDTQTGEGVCEHTSRSLPFIGVAQVLVESKENYEYNHQRTQREAGRPVSSSASSLPLSEVFSTDLVRQVVSLREEVVLMRLRPSEPAKRVPLPGAIPGFPAGKTTSTAIYNKRAREEMTSTEEATDGDKNECDEEKDTRTTPTVADANLAMAAREFRTRGRNRLGWGPDAHKNFASNYVPSPQKLLARPRRPVHRRKTVGAERVAKSGQREEGSLSGRDVAQASTPVLTPQPAAGVAEDDSAPATARHSSFLPPAFAEQPPTTARFVLPSLDIRKTFHDAVVAGKETAPHQSALDVSALQLVNPAESRKPLSSAATPPQCDKTSPALKHTPPEQNTARCLQYEESSDSRNVSKGNSHEKPFTQSTGPLCSPLLPPAPLGAEQPQQALTQLALTSNAHCHLTEKESPCPLRTGPASTPPKALAPAEPQAKEAPPPLPKGWGDGAATYFDPATYCDNPNRANVCHRSPVRARRHVELPAYFSILDCCLSDRAIVNKLSQMNQGKHSSAK